MALRMGAKFPPCPLRIYRCRNPVACSDAKLSTITAMKRGGAQRQRAGEPGMEMRLPDRQCGRHQHLVGRTKAARDHLGARWSVPVRPIGPCCSVAPTGQIRPGVLDMYSATAGEVIISRRICAESPGESVRFPCKFCTPRASVAGSLEHGSPCVRQTLPARADLPHIAAFVALLALAVWGIAAGAGAMPYRWQWARVAPYVAKNFNGQSDPVPCCWDWVSLCASPPWLSWSC